MRNTSRRMIALILLASLAVSGCLAGRSPDQYGYTLVIGIDEGETKPYYVSMLIQRGSSNEDSMGVECSDIFEASSLLEGALPYTLNFSRATALVFSRETAENGLMEEFLSVPLGAIGIRHYANLLISTCRAEDFLSGIQGNENENVAKYQYSLVEYGESTGYIPSITLAQFYARAKNSAGDVAIPLGAGAGRQGGRDVRENEKPMRESGEAQNEPESGAEPEMAVEEAFLLEDPIELDLLGSAEFLPESAILGGDLTYAVMGCMVFNGARAAGILNGEHTQALLMATGQFKNCRMRIPVMGRVYNVLLQQKSGPKVKLTLGEKPGAVISLSLSAAIDEPTSQDDREVIEREIGAYLEDMLQAVFVACRDKEADVFLLGKSAVTKFYDTRSWENYDWKSAYRMTEAEFRVDVAQKSNNSVSALE